MSGLAGTSHSKSKVIGRSQDTARAWLHFAGSSTITDSFNVNSITDNAVGSYTINTALQQTNTSSKTASAGFFGANVELENNTSGASFGIFVKDINGLAARDPNIVCVVVFGDG